jgi:hypothetical protein
MSRAITVPAGETRVLDAGDYRLEIVRNQSTGPALIEGQLIEAGSAWPSPYAPIRSVTITALDVDVVAVAQ